MVILVTGASHTGKTLLAQRLLEKYRYPCISIDLLKMGLIRSGYTDLTPEDDGKLTEYLWLVMTERYIRAHFDDVRAYASVIENRGADEGLTLEGVLADNADFLARCRANGVEPLLIDDKYDVQAAL